MKKMSISSLLYIDTDKLFEEKSIEEIQTTQKQIQAEIERKREELRTMVGERYRDLIEAADTISDMKVTAESVIGHIEKMSTKCQQLQQTHLLGFKLDPSDNAKPAKIIASQGHHSVAMQIKILMDVPEQIWTAVEDEDFLLGTQLFLFSRHINTGLKLHLGADIFATNLTHNFPVVLRQWSAISHFHEAILIGCQKKLQSHNLTNQEASSCLSTLVLLEGIGSLQLLDTFLELRTKAVEQVLTSSQGGVRSRICTSLQLMTQTITLLHACFIGSCEGDETTPEGIVWKQLKAITGRDAPPSISLLDLKHAIAAKFLPPIIQDFRPSTSERVNPVPPGSMRERVTEWLGRMEKLAEGQVSNLLLAVATVRGLQAIREEATSLPGIPKENVSWDTICQQLMIPRGLNLWQTYYQPLITSRAKNIVKQNWISILDQLCETIKKNLQEGVNQGESEQDLGWFIWSEWASDLPQGDTKLCQPKTGGLSMKAKGYSPRVELLCSGFDNQLGALLTDLQHYLGKEEHAILMPTTGSDKFIDKSEIQQHLQACTMENCKRLVEFIRGECVKQNSEVCSILMARFLQSMADLCSNLKKCLVQSGHTKEGSLWLQLVGILRQESLASWQLWRASISLRLQKMVGEKLCERPQLTDMLNLLPQWDVVSIEEEGEEGRSIRSEIRVPAQPSLPLQSLLSAVCQELNAIAPHTLPTVIHQELIESLVQTIFSHFDALSVSDVVTQALALQMLLDVKYITLLLVPRDNKILMGKSQEINDKIEDKIDPFDLDVFTPYIQNNIKKSVQRTQCLLGVLVAWPEKLAVIGLRGVASQSGVEEPNVLPLAPTCSWFPLLPTSGTPGQRQSTRLQAEKTPSKKASGPKPKVEASPGEIVRSGAAAFFGAMSTDWFGS